MAAKQKEEERGDFLNEFSEAPSFQFITELRNPWWYQYEQKKENHLLAVAAMPLTTTRSSVAEERKDSDLVETRESGDAISV